jgi:hypothetical protein
VIEVYDPTEAVRRGLVAQINTQVESEDEAEERLRLERKYGQVWNTKEVQEVFTIESFLAPFCFATHKETGASGMLTFQHWPRFYFLWIPD